MSPRRLVAAGVLRRRPCGSALSEPSVVEVYEGRLTPVLGVNLLDVALGAAKGRLLPAGLRDDLQGVPAETPELAAGSVTVSVAGSWVLWCSDCRWEPVGGPWSLAGAEYLARQHDVVHHGGAWTAEARPAAEVARLAGLAAGGAR